MHRFKTIWKGQKIVRKHLSLPEPVFKVFKEEVDSINGGNYSLLLEKILCDRYKIKSSTVIEPSYN